MEKADMSKKLDSVRRSLFQDFDDDDDTLDKLGNDSQKSTRTSIKINGTFIAAAVVITVAIAALSNKVIQSVLTDLGVDLKMKFDTSVEWTQTNYIHLTQPLLVSILISLFTMMIIYFDSDIPGVSPPTPFSPRKAHQIRYATHKEKTNHLGFLVSIGSGFITFFLLYLK